MIFPKATITKRTDITPYLWVIRLLPEIPFSFKSGQYCTIGVDALERAYSIVSAPHERELELFIELVPAPGGDLTPLLHRLGEDDQVTIRPKAKGLFLLHDAYPNHLMVATVTGIAPFVSILRSYFHEGRRGNRFYVLHGASYADEFAYDRELSEMAKSHPGVVMYAPTVSRPDDARNDGWTGRKGRVNTLVEDHIKRFGLKPQDTLIYACGHPGMIVDVKAQSNAFGFAVKQERYWRDVSPAKTAT